MATTLATPSIESTPKIREANFGEILGVRANLHQQDIGPPDLIHRSVYAGSKSALYNQDDFIIDKLKKDDDGYIGYYHYVNGMTLDNVESYVLELIELGAPYRRDIIVTYCSFNIFHSADFRIKYVVHHKDLLIDRTYQISGRAVKAVPESFKLELEASQIVRLFYHLDNPEHQTVGVANFADFIKTKAAVKQSINTLVKFLPKGYLTGTASLYGAATSCGDDRKTNYYRNRLVDAIIRLDKLGGSEGVGEHIAALYGDEFNYVVLRLIKDELEYVRLISASIGGDLYTTQLALILVEQIKFLIARDQFQLALEIAKKTILILPLDYDCWFHLALCYILVKDFENALLIINALPIIINKHKTSRELPDLFVDTFIERLETDEVISEKSLHEYFPNPTSTEGTELGSIEKMWQDYFLFNPLIRHPVVGQYFLQSPLVSSSAMEIASVDTILIKICGPSSTKNSFASQSAGVSNASILDFTRKSTWGRTYDLLSLMVALVGWERVISIKEHIFKLSVEESEVKDYVVDHGIKERLVTCETWLEQLFITIYEDLRSLMITIANNKNQERSALEWEMIGLLGWPVKHNLRDSISSLVTSVMGRNLQGEFDYFGTVQLLEIYDEFILDNPQYHDSYNGKFLSNKLILKVSSDKMYDNLIKSIEEEYFKLDFILLAIMKLVSWNTRWYQYSPGYLVTSILQKLISKYDLVYLMTRIKIIYELNKRQKVTKSLFGKKKKELPYEFTETDTIYEYMEHLVNWIDSFY
ncbi:Chitin biosynthesis protein CHS6 [Candida viswanathii]|uniref:Chitin biosynthesis protein CHS6 n=1 Tax=Candida viswanathii TaxID=5486 RepID=A0A367YHM2_9ASCO|nr:Chitin biosynthesis protein CHS6 [Candida viswanathii]